MNTTHPFSVSAILSLLLASCSPAPGPDQQTTADLILHNAKIYTFAWGEPDLDGRPAADAPHDQGGWQPDAQAIAISGAHIVGVGTDQEALAFAGPETRIVDLDGATVLPGFVDSHAHAASYGEIISRISLLGVETEEEAVERIAAAAATTPPGEWVLAWGFDEGAWADRLPDKQLLSERVPDHPVHARGLHGFASWNNELALRRAGIDATTEAPVGGTIVLDASGEPTGVLLNNASDIFDDSVIPPPTLEQRAASTTLGLRALAHLGFVGVHEAGVGRSAIEAYQQLAAHGEMPIRAYLMLSISDRSLIQEWIEQGPWFDPAGTLTIRSIKAYYDGSLGARGARLLQDYSDQPGHRGVSGSDYGFDQELAAAGMKAGFQIGIHAIGDAGNREVLDFFESVYDMHPEARDNRNRIEHAQIVHADDRDRFAALDIIASMQPPHAVEDMAWAEERLGAERIDHGYSWRSLRQAGARLVFNSDLSGSDPNLFYGLHAAITRRNKAREPHGGWLPEQSLTPEEAVRAYTTWNAFSSFHEEVTGKLEPGRWADLTITDIDPLAVGTDAPDRLLEGKVLMTVVAGEVVFEFGVTETVDGALYSNPLPAFEAGH